MTETDGEILARMGTDAAKWTDEFMRIRHEKGPFANPNEEWGVMVGWFANAIGAGETKGLQDGLKDRTEWA